jgi:creatinine amidohydrolase
MNLADLSWPQVEALDRNTPVVIPVAALEQHGRHMPVFTDSMLLGEVVRRVSEKCKDNTLFVPLIWLGNSHHHLDFPGTLSAEPRLYLDLLSELMRQFIGYGFRRITFLNGHGGNITPGKQAVFEVRQQYRQRTDLLLLFATYWDCLPTGYQKPRDFVQTDMGHACEWETSMILRIAPHLVGDAARVEDVPATYGFEPAYRGWTTKDRTAPGHIGAPRHANTDKGEHLFQTFTNGVIEDLDRIRRWDGRTW